MTKKRRKKRNKQKNRSKIYFHPKSWIVIFAVIVSLAQTCLTLITTLKTTNLELFKLSLISKLSPYIIGDILIIVITWLAIKRLTNYKRSQDNTAILKIHDKSRQMAKTQSFNLISALFVIFLIKSCFMLKLGMV